MTLILLNLQSNQLIKLDNENPLIIGRGNVKGCFDKRVSRNHGRITCTLDGRIRLEALHCNPCFVTRNGVPPILQINKNQEETLKEGDFLGLLPNAFWFKVTTDKDIKIKKEAENIKTEIISHENNATDKVKENDSAFIPENKNVVEEGATSGVVKSEENSTSSSSIINPSSGFGTPEFEKTRRLPLWMYEIDEQGDTNRSSNKRFVGRDVSRSKKKQKTSTEVDKEHEENTGGGGDVNDVNAFNIPSTSRVVNIEESDPISCIEGSGAESESKEDTNKKEGYESDVNDKEGCGSRPICQYEGKCYRKNPQHKLEFSHPGDSDYVVYEDRPLCPYGGACYRKNGKHKAEFKHPKPSSSSSRGSIASSPLPAKRRRKKVIKENSDVEDVDEYDLEDPFINDASSDEYVPTDSEEEDLDASRDED